MWFNVWKYYLQALRVKAQRNLDQLVITSEDPEARAALWDASQATLQHLREAAEDLQDPRNAELRLLRAQLAAAEGLSGPTAWTRRARTRIAYLEASIRRGL